MRKSTTAVLALLLLVCSLAAIAAEPCRYSAPRNADFDAAGLQALALELGPNVLTLRGEAGLTRIVVHGTACASNRDWLPQVKIDTARSGAMLHLIADNGDHDVNLSLFGGSYAYLKLDVRVPAALATRLTIGSGDADAARLARLDATVGSGGLKLAGITGPLVLRVGSGDVVGSAVGSLDLASLGSGNVSLTGVGGAAAVDTVGSGDLALKDVRGGVTLQALASGEVKLDTVAGGVTVGSVGSGDLAARQVTGNVSVRALASGDVRVHDAKGNVHADSVDSGSFAADGVGGDFTVGELGSGDASHRDVKGKVSAPRHD